jgi:hypothetical protein
VHASVPVVILYLPAAQDVHGPPFGPVKPKLQVQLASVVPALPEFAGQAVHVPPLVPQNPALHVQLVISVFSPDEVESAGQAVQVFPEGHVVFVKSTPLIMALAIAVVASVVSNSSTMKAPATAAFK